MAAADYRLCDICKSKTFYDSDLNYDLPDFDGSIRGRDYSLERTGDWKVICRECAKTHKVVILPIDDQRPDLEIIAEFDSMPPVGMEFGS